MLRINDQIEIADWELTESFARSSGPGGQETRSQARNREIARERLAELVRRATVVPKKRRPTRPTKGSVERRLKAKKVRGAVKNLRGGVDPE